MQLLNTKTMFKFLIIFSSWTSLISGRPVDERQEQSKPQPQNDDYAVLKTFVGKIKHRISLGKDVAEYKWIEGKAILDETREKAVLKKTQEMAEGMGFAFDTEDRLFFVDLMEATKLVEYVYVSDWYGAEKDDIAPKQSVSLDETRAKISGMQKELLELLFGLKTLQNANDCQILIAKAIKETVHEDRLLREAVQRTFGNYCKENISHKFELHN